MTQENAQATEAPAPTPATVATATMTANYAAMKASAAGRQNFAHTMNRGLAKMTDAAPKGFDVKHMVLAFENEVYKNPQLAECTVGSFLSCALNCATLGLDPSSVLGHAYLVPYNNKKKNCTEAQFQIGYRGMIELAMRSGKIKRIHADIVYANDDFDEIGGFEPRLEHRPCRHGDRGAIVMVYAVAKLANGEYQYVVMTKQEIDFIRNKNAAQNSAAWRDQWGEMAKKTAIRRLFKTLPVSIMSPEQTSVIEQTEHVSENTIEGEYREHTYVDEDCVISEE